MLRRLAPTVVAAGAVAAVTLSGACGLREPLEPPEAYGTYCARCHGDDGLGDPKAVRLNPKLDLVGSEMVQEGDAALVRRRIAEGRGAMPGFERKLTAEEMDALTTYTLERFGPSPEPTPPPPSPDGPSGG